MPMLPPSLAMMSRQIARPSPVPLGFVLNRGAKTRSRFSDEMPLPVSEMITVAVCSAASMATVSWPCCCIAWQAFRSTLSRT
jgi:hypothetical protein